LLKEKMFRLEATGFISEAQVQSEIQKASVLFLPTTKTDKAFLLQQRAI